MKALTNFKTTVTKDGKVTITADLVEKQFDPRMVQQITVGFLAKNNRNFARLAQMSHEAIFIKAPTRAAFAIELEPLIDGVAVALEPKLTYGPRFIPGKTALVLEIDSELTPDIQWEEGDTLTGPWTNIAGQTGRELDRTKVTKQYVRCKASSEAGYTTTPPYYIKKDGE